MTPECPAVPSVPPEVPPRSWPFRVRFSGAGGEYFRIWIVNLLLMLVTLGIYYPWARVRRLRYFYANTWIEPWHPGAGEAGAQRYGLDFHARPKQMLGATVVIGLAFIVYSVASNVDQLLAAVLAMAVAAITPIVTRSSLRFRMANTSWRGLRLAFDGSLANAYRVYWPILIPLLLFVASVVMSVSGLGSTNVDVAAGSGPVDPPIGRSGWPQPLAIGLALASVLAGYLILPWLWLRLARYRHSHYVYGSLRSGFTLRFGQVIGLQLRVALVGLLTLAIAAAVSLLLAWFFGDSMQTAFQSGRIPVGSGAAFMTSFMIFMLPIAFFSIRLLVYPYVLVQQQNAVWSATCSDDVRFRSALSFPRTAGLTALNWVLTLVTLGLYRPFADVAMTRLRLEAIDGAFAKDPADVIGRERERRSALGDVGADLFDIGGAF